MSVLSTSFILCVAVGFLPLWVNKKKPGGPFYFSRTIFAINLLARLLICYMWYNLLYSVRNSYLASTYCFLHQSIILYTHISWGVLGARDTAQLLNSAQHLLRCTEPRPFSITDHLPSLAILFYIVKPITLPGNFVVFPALNFMIFFRCMQIVAIYALLYSTTHTAELVLKTNNENIKKAKNDSDLKNAIMLYWRVKKFLKCISKTLAARHFPLFLVNVCFSILTVLIIIRPAFSAGKRIQIKQMVIYGVEWLGPFYCLSILCKRSQVMYTESRKIKQNLQVLLIKDSPTKFSRELIVQFMRAVDDDELYLKAEGTLSYDFCLFLMVTNLIMINGMALLPIATQIT